MLDAVLAAVAARIPPRPGRVRVGVDGVDGSGKTTFADSLAEHLRDQGRTVVRVHEDDFLHPRAVRYRLGRSSPEGYVADSYDLPRLRADVLVPFAPGGDGRYRDRSLDLVADRPLDPPWLQAPEDAVLVLDGMFLHRDELVGTWDVSVWLEAPFEETCRRMALRDGSDPDPASSSMRRYVEGQRLYLAWCRPAVRATVVIDNGDVRAPRVVQLR